MMGGKILYVINGLGTGGTERSLAEMLPRFAQAGFTPIIVAFHRRKEGVEESVLGRGFDVRFVSGRQVISRVSELRRIIASERPDLVHTTIFEADIAGRLAAIRTGVPVISSLISTPYAPVRLRDPNIRRSRLRAAQLIDGWTARHFATHFHAVTNAVKTAAVATLRVPEHRVTVIERGREPERLGRAGLERRRRVRARLGFSDRDELLLNVGRQEYAKAQRDLLESMSILARRPQLNLLIAGREGNASAALARLRDDFNLSERVRFLGHRDDVPDLLAAADIFVFPSLYEGIGGAVIEAMALGLPIVATEIAALREVVEPGRNALLVEPESPRKLARAINTLLDNRSKGQSFGARSQQIFEERFTIDRSADRMIELYRKVLAPIGPRHPAGALET
jgi:glycosyltransferase involved in cell wall biosynthesis